MIYALEFRRGGPDHDPDKGPAGEWIVWWNRDPDLGQILVDAFHDRPSGYDAARITILPEGGRL